MFITRKQVGNNMVVILTGHYEARLQEEEQECKHPCYENVRKKSGQAWGVEGQTCLEEEKPHAAAL